MSEKLELSVGILTISDTRTLDTDLSGQKIESLLHEAGLHIFSRLVKIDDKMEIRQGFELLGDADVVITNGGTGIAKRDVTFEALEPFMYQEIPGFGEFFRKLSFDQIGTHAMASRATAFFTDDDQLAFVLPGSTAACQLAVSQLILPEIYHLIKERRK